MKTNPMNTDRDIIAHLSASENLAPVPDRHDSPYSFNEAEAELPRKISELGAIGRFMKNFNEAEA